MLVLGFDTATPAVSVALHDGERVISAALAVDARRHSEPLYLRRPDAREPGPPKRVTP